MKSLSLVLLLLLLTSAPAEEANVCATTQSDIVVLINEFSNQHGTKFVIDPRVAAKVTLIGVDPSNLTAGTLIGILNLHGFSAMVSNGTVYVMPFVVAEQSGDKFGKTWKG